MKATKARTQAAKRRRGRPRKEGVARTDSDRISRVKEQPSQLALEARARMHSISIEDARDQKAGSFLGRLHMAYLSWQKADKNKPLPEMSLTTTQYHALVQCQELYNERLKVIGSGAAYYARHLGNSGDEGAQERWGASINKQWTDLREAIQEAQNYDRANNLWAALDLLVLQEQELPHMMGSLRTLANTLARHYAKGPKRKELRPARKIPAESL